MARIYIGGDGGNVGWVDPDTMAYIALPGIPGGYAVYGLCVVAEDDIWAGLKGPTGGKPVISHYDGISWTNDTLAWVPSADGGYSWYVTAFQYFSVTELYATVCGRVGGSANTSRVCKWDGVSWSYFYQLKSWGTGRLWGVDGNHLYFGGYNTQHCRFWNGAAIVSSGIIGNSSSTCVGGCIRSDGEVFWLDNTQDDLWQANGAITNPWTKIKDMGGAGYGAKDLWLNPSTDDIYILDGNSGINLERIWKFDGSTWTNSGNLFLAGGDITSRMTGLHAAADLLFVGQAGGAAPNEQAVVRVIWGGATTTQPVGFPVRAVEAYGMYDTDPPYLANHDPVPGATGVAPLHPVTVDVLDDGLGVDAATTGIYVDTGAGAMLVWAAGAVASSDWTGSVSAQPLGYRYELTPLVLYTSEGSVTIRVQADDIVGNSLDDSYSFAVASHHPLNNRSFEEEGTDPGDANWWTELVTTAAETVADFEHSSTYPVPWDDFEDSWESNQLSQVAFALTDLVAALFEGTSIDHENFEYSWQEPATGTTYNHQSIYIFSFENFSSAEFDSEDYEDLEENWGSSPYNQSSVYLLSAATTALAQFDTGVDDEEDFENDWGISPYNQNSVIAFAPGSFSAADFDTVTEYYEDFEEEWTETYS